MASYDRSSASTEPVSTTPYDASAASGETLRQTTSRTTSSGSRCERVAPAAAARRPDPDHLAGADRLGVGQRVDLALLGAARVDDDLERRAREPALDAPAGQDRPVRDGHEVAVLQHPDVLLVAEAAAELAGSPLSTASESDSTRNGKRASVNSVGRLRLSGTTWMVSSPSA